MKIKKDEIQKKLLDRYSHLSALGDEESSPAYMGEISELGYQDTLASLSSLNEPSIAVYVHLPFCSERCLNCERNSTITQDRRMIDEYLSNLDKEMALVAEQIGAGRKISQLHIGGGTPNYLSDPQLVRLMDILDSHFYINDDTESSIEAHPKRATLTQLELLYGLGFRHINFGVRDLNKDVQKAIGRINSFDMMKDVFKSVRSIGFDKVIMDLMYGLPGQSVSTIEDSTQKLIELSPDRVDCFSFVRRIKLLPHQIAIDLKAVPSRAQKIQIFNKIADAMMKANYNWIGLECFVKNSDELSVAKNQENLRRNWISYTLNPAKNLIGFGVNASSEVNGLCVQNMLDLKEWGDSIAAGILPIKGGVQLREKDLKKRDEMLNLMCNPDLTKSSKLLVPVPALFASNPSH
jgi:oxygen-independent coproporphyrinogen-3 oxidase